MKKMSLLFVTLLVLVSGIIFSGCGNKYKKLNISLGSIRYRSEVYYAEEGEIGLVLDDDNLSKCGVTFNLSGAKEWGSVSVTSSPAEIVKVESCVVDGTTCEVIISALQPVDGGELIITHLGSGKNCKVPINIGMKLRKVNTTNNSYVLERPSFAVDRDDRIFEIPTNQLLDCDPLNHTDLIVWKQKNLASGVEVVSYDREGKEIKDVKMLGSAVKSVILINNKCTSNTQITITPISILDGEVTEYEEEEVTVYVTDLLQKSDVVTTSSTHGDTDNELKKLALISNPSDLRAGNTIEGYNLYSTAIIEFMNIVKEGDDPTYQSLDLMNPLFKSLYDITVSTNIQGLTLEYVKFGQIRAIATSTCYGEGYIDVKFSPKNCVGDINQFTINIPCTVGEHATLFSVVNNGQKVDISNSAQTDYNFEATTALNDSNSVGQAFRFEILSTNTLSALKQYRIEIHKDVLYNNSRVLEGAYSKDKSVQSYQSYNTSGLSGNLYQISILKDGNETYFYHESLDSDYFISEPLSSRNTIYIKWSLNEGKPLNAGLPFGIKISNWYNGEFDLIKDNHFADTQIKLALNFDRQRTVGAVKYIPAKATYTPSGAVKWNIEGASDAKDDWNFYFDINNLTAKNSIYYGILIDEVYGLNNEVLTKEEKANINIEISTNCNGLGSAILTDSPNITFERKTTFNYSAGMENVVLIGAYDDVLCGDYAVEFRQRGSDINAKPLLKRDVKIYKPLEDSDVEISVPLAKFRGDVLEPDYTKVELSSVPAGGWDGYYTYYNGEYKQATGSFNPDETYYKKQELLINYQEVELTETPDSWEGYYICDDGEYEPATGEWSVDKQYYVNRLKDVYVLSSSSQYGVKIEYKNKDFIGFNGLEYNAEIVGTLNPLLYGVSNIPQVDENGNYIINTSIDGTFNIDADRKNFVTITYTISVKEYDYYKGKTDALSKPVIKEIVKSIDIYIYEPVTEAVLNKTNLEKYDYGAINNDELKAIYGTETLTLQLNNNDADMLKYVDIDWSTVGDGISNQFIEDENKCYIKFTGPEDYYEQDLRAKYTGRIIATVNQFGAKIPVYCSYSVLQPILSQGVELNTAVNVFKSGDPYINLKVGETKQFDARAKSSIGPVSFDMVEYVLCNQSGGQLTGVATVTSNGLLQATNPGKAKLIIVAKDSVSADWITTQNDYLTYINNKPHIVVDIIISDGSTEFPYLISNSSDFANIQQDFNQTTNINNNNYALVSNINLNGRGVTITGEFSGSLSSYQQYAEDNTRYKISGVMLDCENPILFENLTGLIKNVDFVADINYTEQESNKDVLIGVVGTNSGTIENVTIIAGGNVVIGQYKSNYTIGTLVANNVGVVRLVDKKLVAVEANIKVEGNKDSNITLGGIIGQNSGSLIGANANTTISSDDPSSKSDYSAVYYGKEGITAYVDLQVTKSRNSGALGGAIGFNNGGTVANVYTDGTVLGIDNNKNLAVNNVGGIIGKNYQSSNLYARITVGTPSGGVGTVITGAQFTKDQFQITNSYSTSKVKGYDYVGGVVGYDTNGSYKKVYYEMYTSGDGVVGNKNVGGLIGCANDSDLLYCYANNFGWGYKSADKVDVYDIVGVQSVGGLIGNAISTGIHDDIAEDDYKVVTIISSAGSVNISGSSNVAGLVGRLTNFGAIYTAYYYGVIKSTTYQGIVNYDDNEPYNNVYAIVNDNKKVDKLLNPLSGFKIEQTQNNEEPYILGEDGKNIINPVPTLITIDNALQHWYKQDDNGEYYYNESLGEYDLYNTNLGISVKRFTLRGSVVPAETENTNMSDYRKHALILYYYGLTDMSDEHSLDATYEFNKVNMHDIIGDQKIVVTPVTLRRFNLKSSDPSVAQVLDGGYLLLLNEGQVVITITSVINPSVSASFVVIVRSKVKAFSLHSSANLHNDFNIQDKTLNIVKGSSKIIYPNVKSTVEYYQKTFNYKPATHMGTELTITCPSDTSKIIGNYISLNGTLITSNNIIKYDDKNNVIPADDNKTPTTTCAGAVYRIPFGTPITITVKEYCDKTFNVTAKPYVIADYTTDEGTPSQITEIIQPYSSTFTISTKKGASAINANVHQLVMMPADGQTDLDVKISTDTQLPDVYIDIESIGDWQVENPLWNETMPEDQKTINIVDMLTIKGLELVDLNGAQTGYGDNPTYKLDKKIYRFDISEKPLNNNLQEFTLKLKLNDKSYYIKQSLKLQITIYLLDESRNRVRLDGQYVQSVTFVDIEPQTISSMVPRNYRVQNVQNGEIYNKNLKQSTIIRPGSTNIISIDIAPNIAMFDYVEIIDTSTIERILFRQVYKNSSGVYTTPTNMDKWIDNGIELRKLGTSGLKDETASQLFIEARLPIKSISNVAHEVSMVAYLDGKIVGTSYLILEAIAYPSVVMTYTEPNGTIIEADTRLATKIEPDDSGKMVVKAQNKADLAVGVEAGVEVQTFNTDAGSLKHSIKILTNAGDDVTDTYSGVLKVEQRYNKYILLFNTDKKSDWTKLIGNSVCLTFSASKTINGVTESCEATIEFTIRKFVVYGVSMTHTSSQGDLYGNWDEEFSSQFYFDKTDISYYNGGYWNIQYKMLTDNQIQNIPDDPQKQDIEAINNMLQGLNSLWSGKKITLIDLNDRTKDVTLNANIFKSGFSIKNNDNSFKFLAQDPSVSGGENINNYRFRVEFDTEYNDYHMPILLKDGTRLTREYGFNVSQKTTPFDEYKTIYTQAEFEDMLEGNYYKLGNDIVLTNYTPVNVAIGGFNGGEYSIKISSFNEDQLINDYLTGDVYIGLFGTLAENSVIQNLRVEYSNVSLNLNPQYEDHPANNVYFGGVAGKNLGVITNVQVSGSFALQANDIAAQLIDFGGITAINGEYQTTKDATITNSSVSLQMEAIALIGGVVGTNNGKIVNTNFAGNIKSFSNSLPHYASDVLTAGFAVNNSSNATISLSYVEFETSDNNIRSVGNTAGFVLDNSGSINNCYISNAQIFTQGNIGGFAYSSSGSITNSYSYVQTENSLFYNKFIYETSQSGTITNCYCITESGSNLKVDGLTVVKPNDIEQTEWDGFIFAESIDWSTSAGVGIWSKSANGPKLLNAGFNSNSQEYDSTYNIYDVETYEGWFAQLNDIIEGVKIRLVRDIDFEAEGFVGNPVTVNKTLMSNIEGNNMEIRNFTIYKIEQDTDSSSNNFVGLFSEIKNACINNLVVKPTEIKASSAYAVGSLAGVMDSVKLYNITVDNNNLLILGRNAVGGLAGIIKGDIEIVGVSSNISVLAGYKHNIGSQYNMYLGKNVTGIVGYDNVNKVSYAGSIAGIINGYGNSSMQTTRDIDNYYVVRNVRINDSVILGGENVGALFGLMGELTLLKDSHYEVPSQTRYQGAYVSGGLVGENRGIVQNCSITTKVEDDDTVDKSKSFDNFAKVNGGLVGINVGGLVYNCTVNIDVCTNVRFATVGGVIGRNIEGSVYNTTLAGGKLKGYYVGGIVGADYKYNTMSKPQSGESTITADTLGVFNILASDGFVTYSDSGLTGFDNQIPFSSNVFTKAFMETFISNKTYNFNNQYASNTDKLINASSIYGLVAGYSEYKYAVNGNCTYADNQMSISLEVNNDYSPSVEHKMQLPDGTDIGIKCISELLAPTLYQMFSINTTQQDDKVKMLYLVAYEGAGYESWSSANGYSTKFIIVTQSASS